MVLQTKPLESDAHWKGLAGARLEGRGQDVMR
jgi:hypothetical protein